MIFSIEINDRVYRIDVENPLDISIPLDFNGAQPNAYGVERASSTPCAAGNIVGDTRRGGSCNFEQVTFIPHCNGTHTESIGHLTDERISVHECLQDSFIPATLISVQPEYARASGESYVVELSKNDQFITKRAVEKSLENTNADFQRALIVRTLPNDAGKQSKTYSDEIAPFFSLEAMRLMRELKVHHLLADSPSIDRIFDEGKLANHRIFWNIAPGSRQTYEMSLINHTITEMIYVADEIADGAYLLNLQIAAFAADAAPSRPRLFRIYE